MNHKGSEVKHISTSEAKKRANKKYDAKTYKRYQLVIRKSEQQVINTLDSMQSKSRYITELIKADISKKEQERGNKHEQQTI